MNPRSEREARPRPDARNEELDTLAQGTGLAVGKVIGDRYEIRALLGCGGMGDVWRAFDLRLRVEVALKALRPGLVQKHGLELLRQEVRSAREVHSPNVCRIFDLVVAGGHELLSMEFVDGITLLDLLQQRGPLDLREAAELAAQFLSGLEAIHRAHLVHRDLKPENIMVTRAQRVVVMDFGIAKSLATGSGGTVAGTPAYMAPEQGRGEALDARSDVFSAGLILAEMTARGGIRERSSRESVWRGARERPPRPPDSPWQAVLRRALSPDPDERHPTARALALALEEATRRVEVADDRAPYPGLASFDRGNADLFFGREAEVEAILKKLGHPRLLAVIGPSGAGKSSLIQAGILPALPEGWGAISCRPASAPFLSLARALVPVFTGDAEATEQLLRFEDPATAIAVLLRWRRRHSAALVVVDQFEELFTLNPPEVRARFVGLLARAALEADVHVLLSLRDDFLFQCHEEPALDPIFSELTPLGPLSGPALRQALVNPALACGYQFEDEALVEQVLAEVRETRGALPLLAFAAARLWEKRDRTAGQLTRRAYAEIGGVAGALAQHAEATLERIGPERQSIVRELLGNLVTAQGTRRGRDADELLSVFEDRGPAREVLDALVDARLLTSFEGSGQADGAPRRHVEIVHESLLTAWPRLVRWRTQDADGAQLRDQLGQAAHLWEERGKPDDLLWTGTSLKEFVLWRERYPGRLTATEETFATAMVAQAGRRRKVRRLARLSVVGALVAVIAVVAGLWQQARVAARRAEANRLFALGRLVLEENPSAAIAYMIASLELVDHPDPRRLSLEALWRGPTAIVATRRSAWSLDFSPDGKRLARAGMSYDLDFFGEEGGPAHVLRAPDTSRTGLFMDVQFAGDGTLVSSGNSDDITFWALPEGKPIRSLDHETFGRAFWLPRRADHIVSFDTSGSAGERRALRSPATGGDPVEVARFPEPDFFSRAQVLMGAHVDLEGRRLAHGVGRDLFIRSLDGKGAAPRLVGRHPEGITLVRFHPDGETVAAASTKEPTIRLWSLASKSLTPVRILPRPSGWPVDIHFDREGSSLAFGARVYDLVGPADAQPTELRMGDVGQVNMAVYHPEGGWIAVGSMGGVVLFPLGGPHSVELGQQADAAGIAFTPDGKWLAAGHGPILRLWPLTFAAGPRRTLFTGGEEGFGSLGVDGQGRYLLAGDANSGRNRLVSLDGTGATRVLEGFHGEVRTAAISRDGKLAAAGGGWFNKRDTVVRVWDLKTGAITVLDAGDGKIIEDVRFTADDRLVSASADKLRLWDLGTRTSSVLRQDHTFSVAAGARYVLSAGQAGVELQDLRGGPARRLTRHGDRVRVVALDPTETRVITGDSDGVIRVGPLSDEEPHLLLGHRGPIAALAVHPEGRWVASTSEDRTLRLWTGPNGVPFHTLPREEFLDRLRALTNLRVVADPKARNGYRVDVGPFPGWRRVPTW